MKIIIVDDDRSYFDKISEHLKYLGLEFYPKTVEEFESFRSNIGCSFSSKEIVAKKSLEKVIYKIEEFRNNDKNIIFLVDYQLSDCDPETNGVSFCKKILSPEFDERVVFMSGTTNNDDLESILQFIIDNPNCSFVPKKQKNFLQALLEKIHTNDF